MRIEESRYEEFVSVLRELIGYERTLKLQGKEEQMTQKFASFFPTCESEQERICAFLSQDVTQIRQEYIRDLFSTGKYPKEKTKYAGTEVKEFFIVFYWEYIGIPCTQEQFLCAGYYFYGNTYTRI